MSAIEVSKLPGMPSAPAFVKRRRAHPQFDARASAIMAARTLANGGRPRISRDRWARFLNLLREMSAAKACAMSGFSEPAVYKRRSIDDHFRREMDAVYADARRSREERIARSARMVVRRRQPSFLAALSAYLAPVRQARLEALAQRAKDTADKRALRLRSKRKPKDASKPLGEAFTAKLLQNDLYAAARRALPSHLDRANRDDVAADLVLAVLEGEFAIGEMAAKAKEFLQRHNRLFGRFDLSLDAPLTAGSRATFGDMIASDAIHF